MSTEPNGLTPAELDAMPVDAVVLVTEENGTTAFQKQDQYLHGGRWAAYNTGLYTSEELVAGYSPVRRMVPAETIAPDDCRNRIRQALTVIRGIVWPDWTPCQSAPTPPWEDKREISRLGYVRVAAAFVDAGWTPPTRDEVES